MKNLKKAVSVVLLVVMLAALPGIATWAFDVNCVSNDAYGISAYHNPAEVNDAYTFCFAESFAYRFFYNTVFGAVYNG